MTKTLYCKCISRFQDKRYSGKRLHNEMVNGWRCTVCGDEKKKGVVVT